ncbi:MAG TPA: tetratricopeptide repeat protein [Cyclobacteriaceae bacterium]|nr:tetratricopeptide repeat protein [Cyclobacteriaceae bacterium]
MNIKLILISILSIIHFGSLGQPDTTKPSVETSPNGPEKVKYLNDLFREEININPKKAIDYAREAKELAEKINDDTGLAAALNNIGVAYRNQGAVDKALEYYLQALSIVDRLQDKAGVASTKNNIATIYALKRDYLQALNYYLESNQLLVEINDERLPGSLNNIGNIYTELGTFDKALEYFTQAYREAEKQGRKFSDPLNNIGNVNFQQGNLQRAAEYYERALEIEKTNENRINLINTLGNLGAVYAQAKQPKKAEPFLTEAMEIAENSGARAYLPRLYKIYADVYYQQNKMKEAYEALLKYKELNEKLNSEESSRRIAQMEIALEFQEKENQLAILKQREQILEMQANNARIFVILGLMMLVLLVAFGYVYYVYQKGKTEE